MNDEENLDFSSINKKKINKKLRDYSGMTLLHLVTADADVKSITQCLKLGANSLMPDNSGNSPLNLILQSKKCTLELVKLLVDAMRIETQKCSSEKLCLNSPNGLSMTPLGLAITFQTENPEFEQIVEYLLINGANFGIGKSKPNGLFTVTSPLFQASRRGLHNIVRLLLEYAGRKTTEKIINEYYGSGTPLHAAITSGSVETVEVLLKFGADPKKVTKDTNQTPELLAKINTKIYKDKANNYTEIIKLLKHEKEISEAEDDTDANLEEEESEGDDDVADPVIPNLIPNNNGIGYNATAPIAPIAPVAPLAPAPQTRLLDLMGWQGRTTMRLTGALNEVFCEPLALDEAILFFLPAVLSYHRINKFKAIDYIAGILPLCAYGLKAYRGVREPNLLNKPYTFYGILAQWGVLAADWIYLSQIKNRKQQGIYAPASLFQKLTVTPFLINLGRLITCPIRPTLSALA